ncbi:MAG TPA: type II secretion system protein GspJ [Candidatus Nanopelagicales bacterium]|nr:type II secretion system protein GspJ [Candidatus Nanopelagicales bacterium]
MKASRRLHRRHRRGAGLTLVEVLVAVAILAMIGTIIFAVFDGMSKTRRGIGQMSERYHQGRQAVSRIARELQSAFISRHMPVLNQNLLVRRTAFVGEDSSPADRVDFTAFAHRRLLSDAHESDQAEIGYFASRDPEQSGKLDLVRRESKVIDLEPAKGGIVNVLAEDIESFNVQYFDPILGDWVDSWDSTQPAGQIDRLPMQAWITLVLKGVNGEPLKFETKVPLAMQVPLGWADQNPNTQSLSQSGGVQQGSGGNATSALQGGGLPGGAGGLSATPGSPAGGPGAGLGGSRGGMPFGGAMGAGRR